MNLSKLYRVLVLGSSVIVASACGADAVSGAGETKGDPATHGPVAAADPTPDAGGDDAIDAGADAGADAGVLLADAGTVDAGSADDAGGVNSWVSWI